MKKILVVEDEKDMITLVERRLKDKGYSIISAFSGGEALKKFKEGRPDLLLVDVVLPDMNGFEVCRKVKEELDPKVKIIVYTGKLDKVDVDLARKSKADEIVVKSEDLKFVVDKIQEFLKT